MTNMTPLAAACAIRGNPQARARVCRVAAKATFQFSAAGEVELDARSPYPMFDRDEPTPLGVLPRDDVPSPPGFSVYVLAAAHSPQPVPQTRVAACVGPHRRELAIFGDRVWEQGRPSPPEPFRHMPITYERAFGGRCDVLIDHDSPVRVQHPDNPHGRGVDFSASAEQLRELYGCPEGFPQYPSVVCLPNVEDPASLITQPGDTPQPAGWGPLPLDVPLNAKKLVEKAAQPGAAPEPGLPEVIPAELLRRAHPSWFLEGAPELPLPVRLEGLTPELRVDFRVPRLDLQLDYVLGSFSGTRPLEPIALTLLPEEMRFCMSYELEFQYALEPQEERSLRLRYD